MSDQGKTDIIIAIHPKHVINIVCRAKNHEFRKYLLPSTVQRLWIYETSPISAIKYVAQISQAKRPGEILDPQGLRNSEFNEGRFEHLVKFAYEIQALFLTEHPWTLQDLKDNGWLNGPPQKYCYVKKSMLLTLQNDTWTTLFNEKSMSTSCNMEKAATLNGECEDQSGLDTAGKAINNGAKCQYL